MKRLAGSRPFPLRKRRIKNTIRRENATIQFCRMNAHLLAIGQATNRVGAHAAVRRGRGGDCGHRDWQEEKSTGNVVASHIETKYTDLDNLIKENPNKQNFPELIYLNLLKI